MSIRISKDLDDFICISITALFRIVLIATLVVVAMHYSLLTILFFKLIFSLADLCAELFIKCMHYIIDSRGD